ncbi:MAG: 6-phospho-beta-glucosidase [Actinomycetaceae bacterium]|nr:6-phospho-beta-glucosidase [Actinomycetaceae bacterium]
MKLTIAGGGGFRVPQVLDVLSRHDSVFQITDVTLYDVSTMRMGVIENVIHGLYSDRPDLPNITTTTDLGEAVEGADFVFSAMRVGGTDGRVRDERVALENRIIGQETIGPGGQAYALRTLPEAMRLAEAVRDRAPGAWVINFTNPAGIITQAMRTVLGRRVIGICDTPIGLMRKACAAIDVDPADVDFDYVGLNHLGWLRSLEVDGEDRLPQIIASDDLLDRIEEARILGFDWVRALGMLPNEYLFYYYYGRESVARIVESKQTRGEFLRDQQARFYEDAARSPEDAARLWEEAHGEREATYMAESRAEEDRAGRRTEDLGGGYQEVAFSIMKAIVRGEPATMILNVANEDGPDGLLVPGLSAEAVVEVPCTVDGSGVHPHKVAPLTGPEFGLVSTVKAAEERLLDAYFNADADAAWQAMAAHPLVDSISVARDILNGYLADESLQQVLGTNEA